MRALIWKELRENIGWALLAMLALGGGEIYALFQTEQQSDFYFNDGITLCRKPFLAVTMFGCAVVGLALGLLQVLPELKRDRWAALLHRPVSRGRFYWSKALAGTLLYLLAVGAPFALAVTLTATPGNFATPFVPGMIRPGLADIAVGLSYYFAALLLALQGGPMLWRALPLFAALHVSFFAFDVKLFRVALEAAGAMALVLCLAGWGAIHVREALRGRPRLGQIAFFIVAFYGACGVGDLAKKIGIMAGAMGDRKFSSWEVLDNGVPVRLDYVNDVLVAVNDANHKPFTDPKYRPDRVRGHTLGMNTASSFVGNAHGWRPWVYERGYRESSSYLWAASPYSRPRFEQWFTITEPKHYVGMLPVEKKEFARLGADGFAPAGAKVRAFAKEVNGDRIGGDLLVLAAPEALRFVHLGKREITTLALPAPGPIYGMCHAWANTPGGGSRDFQGIALGNGMAVVDASERVVAMLPYAHDADRWGRLSLGVLPTMDRFVLQAEPSEWIPWAQRKTLPTYVENFDAQGKVLASFTLPPLPPNVNPPALTNYLSARLRSPAFFFGEMGYRQIGAALGSDRLKGALAAQFGADFKKTRETVIVVVLLSTALAAITRVWARRAQLSSWRTWLWTLGVLVFGLPGFLVFWLAGERPRTVTCPACRKSRRIDEPLCASCRAPWPANPSDETAIFDREPVAAPL